MFKIFSRKKQKMTDDQFHRRFSHRRRVFFGTQLYDRLRGRWVYLRDFDLHYLQENWIKHLPISDFRHPSSQVTLHYLNTGESPRDLEPSDALTGRMSFGGDITERESVDCERKPSFAQSLVSTSVSHNDYSDSSGSSSISCGGGE